MKLRAVLLSSYKICIGALGHRGIGASGYRGIVASRGKAAAVVSSLWIQKERCLSRHRNEKHFSSLWDITDILVA